MRGARQVFLEGARSPQEEPQKGRFEKTNSKYRDTPVEEMDEATRLARARVIVESLERDEQEAQRILDHARADPGRFVIEERAGGE